jgi:hypothetical protein
LLDNLIGPSELLLVVSYLPIPIWSLNFGFVGRVGKK